ncbi:hypothetical protein MMC19_007690 [Ptychographa xylographoides]|nr:hypothetical protein [Ptychographa xylographoides]
MLYVPKALHPSASGPRAPKRDRSVTTVVPHGRHSASAHGAARPPKAASASTSVLQSILESLKPRASSAHDATVVDLIVATVVAPASQFSTTLLPRSSQSYLHTAGATASVREVRRGSATGTSSPSQFFLTGTFAFSDLASAANPGINRRSIGTGHTAHKTVTSMATTSRKHAGPPRDPGQVLAKG